MTTPTVQTLHLVLSPSPDGGVAARLVGDEAGTAEPPVLAEGTTDATTLDRLSDLLEPLERYVDETPPAGLAEALGRTLAAAALPPEPRSWLLAALRADPGRPLRLCFEAADAALARLPWEFVYLDERLQGASGPVGFLSLYPCLRIVRACSVRGDSTPPTAGPLRVLVVTANPGSPAYPVLPGLGQEVQAVLAALRTGECAAAVDELREATPGALERALAANPPHVLHFVGHAAALPSGGALVLHGERSRTHALMYGAELAGLLANGPTRLVVLSACRTGGDADSVARAVAGGAGTAVLATQLPLRDVSSPLFARAFYGALAGYAPVDEAVAQGRQAVRGVGPDWGVPVLYLPDGAELFAPPASPASAPWTVPYPHNPDFVGRDALLAELHQDLGSPDGRPVAIVGISGAGKTLAAAEYAHAYAREYPGGVLWLNARDLVRLEEDYAAHARFFGVPEDLSTARRAELVRERIRLLETPSLLILDDVAEPADLRLPAGGQCRVLATVRERRAVPEGFRAVEPPPLEAGAALRVLSRGREPGSPDDLKAAADIVACLGSLPIALVVAAREIRRLGLGFEAYLQRLQRHRVRVLSAARGRFVTGTGHDGSVFDALDMSARGLSAAASRVMATAACFAGRGIPRGHLREAAELPSPEDFEDSLGELWDASLVTYEEDERLSMHELVRAYTHGQTRPEELAAAADRVARLLAARLKEADETREWRLVRADIPHCRAALEVCRIAGEPEGMIPLLDQLGGYLLDHGESGAAERCGREALRAAEQRYGSGHPNTAPTMRRLAEACARPSGDIDAAIAMAQRALEIADAALPPGDPARVDYLICVGFAHRWREEFEVAVGFYERALVLARELCGARSTEAALCLNNILSVKMTTGDLGGALASGEEALEVETAVHGPDHVQVAIILNNTGRLLGRLDRWPEALERHRRALAIHTATYGPRNLHVAMSRLFMGQALGHLGEHEEGAEHIEEAYLLLEQLVGPQHNLTRDAAAALDAAREHLAADRDNPGELQSHAN